MKFNKALVAMILAIVMVMGLCTAAMAEDALKMGVIGPFTGAAAIYGNACKYGAQVAADEINAQGGLQVQLLCEDDEHDPEKSVNAYNTVMDQGAQMIVGTTTTTPCIAVSAVAYEERVFMLTPSASSAKVPEGKDNMYQVCFEDPAMGIFSVSETTFTDETTDFSVQVTAAKDAGADLVFLPIYYTPASMILQTAKGMDYAPVFFGVDGMDGILAMEGFDASLADGVILLTPFSAFSEDEHTVDFVAKYQAVSGGETPNQFAADAYDAVYALYNASLAAGIDGSTSAEDACEKLIEQFATLQYSGLTGDMTWTSDGKVSKLPNAYVIKDGGYVAYGE